MFTEAKIIEILRGNSTILSSLKEVISNLI